MADWTTINDREKKQQKAAKKKEERAQAAVAAQEADQERLIQRKKLLEENAEKYEIADGMRSSTMWDAFNEQEPQAQHKQTSHASSQRSKPSTLKEDNDISLLKRAPTTKKSGKSQRKADSAASSSTSSDNVDLAQASEIEHETRSVAMSVLDDQHCGATFQSSHSQITSSLHRILTFRDFSSVAFDFMHWLLQSLFQVSSTRVGLALVFESALMAPSSDTINSIWFSSRKLASVVSKQKIASAENRTLVKWLYRCCSSCLNSSTLTTFLWMEWICSANAFSSSIADGLLTEASSAESPLAVRWIPDKLALASAATRLEALLPRPSNAQFRLAAAMAKAVELSPTSDTVTLVLPLLKVSTETTLNLLLKSLSQVLLVDGPLQLWWISSMKTPESIDASALILQHASENAHLFTSDYNRVAKAVVRQLDRLMSSISKGQKDALKEPVARLRGAVSSFSASANQAELDAVSRRRSGFCVQILLILLALIAALVFIAVLVPTSQLPSPVQPVLSRLRLMIHQLVTKNT